MLYRKYRPQKFAELEGLAAVSSVILAQLKENKIAHAYLFSGPRGTGKTTTARLLAKSLFCEQPSAEGEPCGKCEPCLEITRGSALDLIEIDAASNRGIDDIRSLKETVNLSPGKAKHKVYIIDEVHMLTKEAFNALLKTLEEPPPHVIFVLCTTELNKVPDTILSRCLRFSFRQAQEQDILTKLKRISVSEGFSLDDNILKRIAERAVGGFRDAETLLEQVIYADSSSQETLLESTEVPLVSFCDAVFEANAKKALTILQHYLDGGGVLENFTEGLVVLLRRALLVRAGFSGEEVQGSVEERKWCENVARNIPEETFENMITKITQAVSKPSPKVAKSLSLEMAIISICSVKTVEASLPSIKELEEVKEEAEVQVEVGDVARVIEKWPDILAGVRPHNHSIEALLRSCKPLSFSGSTLLIETLYQFHKDRLTTPTSLRVLKGVLSEVLGTDVDVSFHMGDRPPEPVEEEVRKESSVPEVSTKGTAKVTSGLELFSTEIV